MLTRVYRATKERYTLLWPPNIMAEHGMADGLIRANWSMFYALRKNLSAELKEGIMLGNYDNSRWELGY
jgi:hypothetical protein